LALALAGRVLGRFFGRAARWWGVTVGTVSTIPFDRRTVGIASGLSLGAWLCGCLTLAAVCRGIGIPIATLMDFDGQDR